MCLVDPHEIALWDKIEPWLEGCHLRKDAPSDIVAANEELKRILWDPERGQ